MVDRPDPFAEHMSTVARALFGDPNALHSKPGKPRWGNKGSLAVDEKRGIWFDHENGKGGGVLELIEREKKLSGAEAVEWLQSIGCGVDKPKMNGTQPAPGTRRKIIETYDYIDLDGTLAFQVCRMGFVRPDGTLQLNSAGKPDKTFAQRRPYPGKLTIWIWGASARDYMRKGPGENWYRFDEQGWAKLPPTRERKSFEVAKSIPYNLPAITEAIAFSNPIFIVEGEQKVDALAKWNLRGTCNAGGASKRGGDSKWTAEHAAYLKDADVILLPDNDDAGRDHAQLVAQTLTGIASRIRLLELPGLDPKGDIVDWQKNHTREEFDALVEQAPDWQPQKPHPNDAVAKKSPENGEKVPSEPPPGDAVLESASAASFKMSGLTWLWPNRFALGKLGLLAGLPDRGKGLICADITARITTGKEWPCNEGRALQGNVLLLSAEDDIEDTIKPRLIAAGADLNRIEIVGMVRAGNDRRMFNLISDLALLRQKIDAIGNVVMVQIDPLSAYLGVGKIDSYRTTDVRGVLAPLTELAAAKQVALLGVLHFNKKADVHNAMLRISDSLAFAATARHCYVVVDDPENERRLLVKAKNNLAPDTKALSYGVNALVVGQDQKTGKDVWAPRVVWGLEHVEITATEAMQAEAAGKSPHGAVASAENFLRDLLAAGPVTKTDIEQAAAANCISTASLRRAKDELGVVARKNGFDGGWAWQLPDEKPARKWNGE